MRISLKLAVVTMLVCVTPTAAQWKQDRKQFDGERWSKADGDFGAQLFLTDKPDELFEAWEKPALGVAIHEAKTARRGVPIVAVVVFTGCAPNAKGLSQATVEFTAYRPDGKPYGDPSDCELWIDKPLPAKGQLQLSVGNMGIVIDPGDQLGVYKVRAKVVDKVAKKTLLLERDFTALEADPMATNKAPGPPAAAKRMPIGDQIIGSWRSENVGLDFPMWMVDTYRADGTGTTDFYSQPARKRSITRT